ncbi:MAG: ROK family protein [Micropruina sp.]|uniref:ROK family protein n=1 Tax=Micropruina sp. TaxID=2737536 RepID=UPI0039E6C4F3
MIHALARMPQDSCPATMQHDSRKDVREYESVPHQIMFASRKCRTASARHRSNVTTVSACSIVPSRVGFVPVNSASSPRVMRRINGDAVLRYALDAEEFSTGDVMSATALTRATVLGVCADLTAGGWLEEVPDVAPAGRRGRPSRRYRVPPDAGLLLGLDAGEHRLRAVLTDLHGRPLGTRESLLRAASASGRERLSTTSTLIADLLAGVGASADEVLISVAGVPAPVDADGRSPVDDKGFWTAMNPGFPDVLPGKVIVENDANLAVIAERTCLSAGENIAALLSGERFGAGLIVDGRLLRGAHGGAGELRAMGIVVGAGSPDGLAALARTWALELLADERTTRQGVLPQPSGAVDAAWVFHAAEQGAPGAQEIVARLGRRLARVAMILGSLLDVTTIVVAGAIAPAIEPALRAARRQLHAHCPPPVPDIIASTLGGDVVALGAVEQARRLLQADPLSFIPSRSGSAGR